MRFAIADPPYLGSAVRHYGDHPDAAVYDTVEGHARLIERLCDEFPDGWTLSMQSTNLPQLAPLAPTGARFSAWCKPFASFKPNVTIAYAWEPIMWMGGRKRPRTLPTLRDWFTANITLRKGLTGAKPPGFTRYVLDLLNAEPDDEIVDLFPGSGAVSDEVDVWRKQGRLVA